MQSYLLSPDWFLGHTLFGITAGVAGKQPFTNETGDLVGIVNGEIYHTELLRAQLESKGHKFSTPSDCEIILHYFEEYGPEACLNLEGEFSFVIYHILSNTWYLGRDRHGIRPLKYIFNKSHLLIASESKAFKAMGVSLSLNTDTLLQSLSFQYHDPANTWFKEVHSVPVGTVLKIQNNSIVSYAAPVLQSTNYTIEEALELSISCRILTVPFCTHLSGGLDSTLITALAVKHGLKKAYCVDFPDSPYSESAFAKQSAQYLGVDLTVLPYTTADLATALSSAVWHGEAPGINVHYAAKYLLSKAIASDGYKVALTGEGADEYFYGYSHFQHYLNPSFTPNALVAGIHNNPLSINGLPNWLSTKVHLFNPLANLHPQFKHLLPLLTSDTLASAQDSWIKHGLCSYILPVLDDAVGMSGPIESRLPFLDSRVIQAAKALPLSSHKATSVEKPYLRNLFRDILPPHIQTQRKLPFIGPSLLAYVKTKNYNFYDTAKNLEKKAGFNADSLLHWYKTLPLTPENDYLFIYLSTLDCVLHHYVD